MQSRMYLRLAFPPPQRVQQTFRITALVLTFVGTSISAWLTYIELYMLHAVCNWCVISAVTVALLLAVAVAELLPLRQGVSLPTGGGRVRTR